MNDVQLGEGYKTLSVCYNGKSITRAELLLYLFEIIDLRKRADELPRESEQNEVSLNQLKYLMERRKIFMPVMEKPTGFAALSKKRMREYQQWLDDAPKREEERKQKEAEEDQRIADVKRRYDETMNKGFQLINEMHSVGNRYKDLMSLNVLAPQYRINHIPEQLLEYLFSGRAMTLTEAINIYHEEQYRLKMMSLAQQQLNEVKKAREEQLQMAYEQLKVLNEQKELQRQALEAVEATRRSVRNIEFITFLDYISD